MTRTMFIFRWWLRAFLLFSFSMAVCQAFHRGPVGLLYAGGYAWLALLFSWPLMLPAGWLLRRLLPLPYSVTARLLFMAWLLTIIADGSLFLLYRLVPDWPSVTENAMQVLLCVAISIFLSAWSCRPQLQKINQSYPMVSCQMEKTHGLR